jgi:hypothetical protein
MFVVKSVAILVRKRGRQGALSGRMERDASIRVRLVYEYAPLGLGTDELSRLLDP